MKKIMLLLSIAAVGLFMSACASVEVVKDPNLNGQAIANSGRTIAHLDAQNWGIYLFTIPLLTGSTENPGSIDVLKDTVNVPSLMPVLTAKSKALGASKTLNLASQYSESGLIFYTRSINISGNAVK
ncbi:MAG: hypothetical protein V8T87_14145 [Victivallales bacterium]|nr:hypothetical protein [Lentisphaeria bacterium]HCG24334.1 hypothetical protein [Lentisphaeria bacterium]HCG51766.1 hypothetical protein [Lentisphaeria bacterium]